MDCKYVLVLILVLALAIQGCIVYRAHSNAAGTFMDVELWQDVDSKRKPTCEFYSTLGSDSLFNFVCNMRLKATFYRPNPTQSNALDTMFYPTIL
jgi:hypothetical protein